MSVLQTAIITNLINEQRNSILDQSRLNDRNAREKNSNDAEKNRLTQQAEKNEEQFLTQAGRANRAERELFHTQNKLNEAEQALVAHSLATDEAFKDLMMEIYGTSPDKEERVKKDLAKLKYRTQQILEKKKNIPIKPDEKNIQDYLKFAYDDNKISKLTSNGLNNLIKIHQSICFWKNEAIDYYPDIVLSQSTMLLYNKPDDKNIQDYLKFAYDDDKISKLTSNGLNNLIKIHQMLYFWKHQEQDAYPNISLSSSSFLNKKENGFNF